MRYYALNKQSLYPDGILRKIQSLSKLLSDPYTPNFVSLPQLFNLIYSNLWYWIDNELIWVPKFVSASQRESKRRKWIWASIFQLSQICNSLELMVLQDVKGPSQPSLFPLTQFLKKRELGIISKNIVRNMNLASIFDK